MNDYMIRGTCGDGSVRFFAATSKNLTEFARTSHGLTPLATATLGRLLSAGAMMGAMMKGKEDLLTIQITCNGPIGGLLVTADSNGCVKGYVQNPKVDLPLKENGHLDVGNALGLGVLSVIRDTGLKEPYVGQTILQTGEIAEDITSYFAESEQVPSVVALGVLVGKDCAVSSAGGFIIQLLPNAKEEVIDLLEKRIAGFSSVTEHLKTGETIEKMMTDLLDGLAPEISEKKEIRFQCNCNREKTKGMLASIARKDREEMIRDGKPIEVVCHFCSKKYTFTVEELKNLQNI